MNTVATETTEPIVATPSRERQWRLLWYVVLSGPVIYTVYFLAAWVVSEYACLGNGLTFSVGAINGVSFVVLMLTLGTLVLLGLSAALAWGAWRRRRATANDDVNAYDNTQGTAATMALSGLLLNLFFVVATLMTGIPSLVLVACDWV